jgi:cell division protease FtsH
LNTFYKNLSMWLVIGLSMIMLFQLFNTPQRPAESITYSEFWSSVESGAINRVHIQGGEITGTGAGWPAIQNQSLPTMRN